MKTTTITRETTTVAATVAGEDIRCGDYIALLHLIYELPTYMWNSCDSLQPLDQLVRLKLMPHDAGEPFKVFAVCLPFVYARTFNDKVKTIDLRRSQVVRLDKASAKRVWTEQKKRTLP